MCASKRILLIDDDVDLCDTFSDVLMAEGHEVHVMNSGNEAFHQVSRLIPDIVILDMQLPGISGILLLSHIRHISRLAHTKVVIVSGNPDLTNTAKAVWGADRCLLKPVAPNELLAAINGVTERM